MTKQEKIREGLEDIFSTLEGGRGEAEHKLADDVLKYLHSQGVVIKNERDLLTMQEAINYEVVEPLIEGI